MDMPPELPDPFDGHPERHCGEHRPVGSHRAYCFDCEVWCVPDSLCPGCRMPWVRKVTGGWVAADLAGWTGQVYSTEAEAWRAVGPARNSDDL